MHEITNSGITSTGITSPTLSPTPHEGHARKQPGPRPLRYGLPCANCRLYYAAELSACPICKCGDRISPTIVLTRPLAML
jgi:hypothetical protein